MHRTGRDELGQLINLRQLATFYRNKGSHQTALARNQDAEFLARKLRNDRLATAILQEQGIILLRLKRNAEALEKFQLSLTMHGVSATKTQRRTVYWLSARPSRRKTGS
ncbi:MAG: hypothetical protein R3F37_14800 [Candidatus Competibacteraceae bacterium]